MLSPEEAILALDGYEREGEVIQSKWDQKRARSRAREREMDAI